MTLAKEKGWKAALSRFASNTQSQVANSATTLQDGRPINFDEPTFQQLLVNFIVADDQVRSLFIFLCLQCSCLHVPKVVECD